MLVKCTLNFIRNCQTVLKGGCAILHYHQQYRRVSYPCQHLNSVHSLNRVQLFATPWTVSHKGSLSITKFWSLLKLMCSESVMPSNHFILCYPLLLLSSIFPSIRVFPGSWIFASGDQRTGASASASVLPMNIQD